MSISFLCLYFFFFFFSFFDIIFWFSLIFFWRTFVCWQYILYILRGRCSMMQHVLFYQCAWLFDSHTIWFVWICFRVTEFMPFFAFLFFFSSSLECAEPPVVFITFCLDKNSFHVLRSALSISIEWPQAVRVKLCNAYSRMSR